MAGRKSIVKILFEVQTGQFSFVENSFDSVADARDWAKDNLSFPYAIVTVWEYKGVYEEQVTRKVYTDKLDTLK